MNAIPAYFDRIASLGKAPAVHENGVEHSYEQLLARSERWSEFLRGHGVGPGVVCAFVGDYSFETCALILALMRERTIFAPLTPAVRSEIGKFMNIAGVEVVLRQETKGQWSVERTGVPC